MPSGARWSARRFVPVAVLALLAGCAGGGSGAGGGGTGGGATGGAAVPASPFAVPNPYATANAADVEDVRVGRAVVFGDSYSALGLWPFRNWAEQLVDDGTFASQANFAVGGAVARGTGPKSLAAQVDAFHRTGAPFRRGDLALVYFGHNDVKGDSGQRDQSKQALSGHLDTLVADGATADSRRLFVMLIHDWSRNPDPRGVDRSTVLDWNAHLVDEANGRQRVVAVDVFTLFERIFADPGRFGFTNVTTVDAANSDSTALYYDGQHFGEAGNRWIARLVRLYLTRGWDWANTLAAGSQAAARLEQDIDRGLLLALADLEAGRRSGLFAFAVGTPEPGSPGVGLSRSEQPAGEVRGAGAGFALPGGTSFAFAAAGGSTAYDTDAGDSNEHGTVDNRAVGFLWGTRLGPLETRSGLFWNRQAFGRRTREAALDSVATAEADGELLRLSQVLSVPLEVGRFALRPELELAWERQRVDAYDMADPYLGRVSFGASEADTVLLGLGVGATAPPVSVGDVGTLSLRADLRLERSLSREDWRVRLREGLTRRTETVARPSVDRLSVGFGADLRLGDGAVVGLELAAVRDGAADDTAYGFVRYRVPLGTTGRTGRSPLRATTRWAAASPR